MSRCIKKLCRADRRAKRKEFMETHIKTDYLGLIFHPHKFKETVRLSVETAKSIMRQVPYDAIVFTGNSGAAIGYILGAELGIPILCIRRETDRCHYIEAGNGIL